MKSTALITGGARRIGRAITLALGQKGFDIALHYNHSGAEAKDLAKQLQAMGRKCQLFACDLAQAERAAGLVEVVFQACPDCSVLINNASVFEGADFLGTDQTMFDANFNVNFKAPFFLSQAFARHCQSGQIINIADARVGRTVTDHFVYTLSKKALWEFTKMAAKQLGPKIRVNAVCPGLVLPSQDQGDDAFDNILPKLPLRRGGSAQQVADAVCFLTESDYITGQAIFVDGGDHLRS